MTTIGLEEEFMLLDPCTLAPVGRAAEVIEAVRMTVHAPFVASEFYASQLEYASPILSTAEDASRALRSFRVALAEIATRLGVVAAGVGLPFDGVGGTTDIGTLNWAARSSARYPTVEVRVFDAQLDATTSLPLALLTRGAIASPSVDDEPALPQELLDAALWHAARYGMSAGLVDPASGSMRPAAEVVRRLLQVAKPGLEAHGDPERVAAFVERTIADGTGAHRQRRAYARGGRDGLGELLANP